MLTGDMMDAEWALEIGLAGWVVADGELMGAAQRLADRLLPGAPLAQRAVTEMAWRGQRLPWVDSAGWARPCDESSVPPTTPTKASALSRTVANHSGPATE